MWGGISILFLLFKVQHGQIYFMHFEKVVTSLKWLEDVWMVLLQSVFVGKSCEIYSALPVEHITRYQVVKDTVLKAYKQVPEACR